MHKGISTGRIPIVFAFAVAGILFSSENIFLYAQEQTPQKPLIQPVQTPPPPPQPAIESQPTKTPQTSIPAAKQVAVKKGEISFNFDDADLFEVIQTVFGDILKVNYMVDPKVKGRVNFRTVAPIPREEAIPIMEALLKLNGAGYTEEKGMYKILPLNEIPGTTPKVFVYPLQNSKAAHIASLLQSIFTGSTSAPRPSPATTPVTTTPASKPGVSAFAAGTGVLVSPDTKVIADEITNSLIILATSTDYSFIEETIKKLDIIPRQVMIEALVASITLTDNLRFGLQWSLDTDIKITNIRPFDNDVKIGGPLELKAPIGSPNFTFTATDRAGKIRLLLQSLAEENKAKVLSSPHILVSDNREAKIQIGDQIPIATSTTTTITTTPAQTTTTIQYKDTGTILKVKPQVNDSGLISLELTQEVSSVSKQTVLGTEQFVISKREVATNLVAQNGQTIVIGGLIREDTTKGRSGIPLLSKIPILGYLFGSTVDDTTRTELIILLTPRVIKNLEDAGNVTSDYIDRLKGVSKDMKIDELMKGKEQKKESSKNSDNVSDKNSQQ